jgi:hypothetical protein
MLAFEQSAAFLAAIQRNDIQTATRIACGVFPASLSAAIGVIGPVHVALVREDHFAASGLAAIARAIAQAQAPMHNASTALDMMSMVMNAARGSSFDNIPPATVEGIEALTAGEQRARGATHAILRYIRIAPTDCEQIGKMIDGLTVTWNGALDTHESKHQFGTLVEGARYRFADLIVTLSVLQSLLRLTRQ